MTNLFYEVTEKDDTQTLQGRRRGRPGRDPLDLHKRMLAAQKNGGDFDLTFRELMPIWGVRSTSVVSYHLSRLQEIGLVKAKPRGTAKAYRAVDAASNA